MGYTASQYLRGQHGSAAVTDTYNRIEDPRERQVFNEFLSQSTTHDFGEFLNNNPNNAYAEWGDMDLWDIYADPQEPRDLYKGQTEGSLPHLDLRPYYSQIYMERHTDKIPEYWLQNNPYGLKFDEGTGLTWAPEENAFPIVPYHTQAPQEQLPGSIPGSDGQVGPPPLPTMQAQQDQASMNYPQQTAAPTNLPGSEGQIGMPILPTMQAQIQQGSPEMYSQSREVAESMYNMSQEDQASAGQFLRQDDYNNINDYLSNMYGGGQGTPSWAMPFQTATDDYNFAARQLY